MMIIMDKPTIPKLEPYELNLAIHRVGMLEMKVWIIMARPSRGKSDTLLVRNRAVVEEATRIIAERRIID
jgi:hypothetical protein